MRRIKGKESVRSSTWALAKVTLSWKWSRQWRLPVEKRCEERLEAYSRFFLQTLPVNYLHRLITTSSIIHPPIITHRSSTKLDPEEKGTLPPAMLTQRRPGKKWAGRRHEDWKKCALTSGSGKAQTPRATVATKEESELRGGNPNFVKLKLQDDFVIFVCRSACPPRFFLACFLLPS